MVRFARRPPTMLLPRATFEATVSISVSEMSRSELWVTTTRFRIALPNAASAPASAIGRWRCKHVVIAQQLRGLGQQGRHDHRPAEREPDRQPDHSRAVDHFPLRKRWIVPGTEHGRDVATPDLLAGQSLDVERETAGIRGGEVEDMQNPAAASLRKWSRSPFLVPNAVHWRDMVQGHARHRAVPCVSHLSSRQARGYHWRTGGHERAAEC